MQTDHSETNSNLTAPPPGATKSGMVLRCTLLASALTMAGGAFAQSVDADGKPKAEPDYLAEFGIEMPEQPRLRVDGFGTLGYTHTDNNRGWSYAADLMQRPTKKSGNWNTDSKIGLQLSYRLSDTVDLTGQYVLRQQAEHAKWDQNIEWAMMSWRPTPDWQVRLGRSNPDFFFQTDYRHVSFAYPWIRPNTEFYGFGSIPYVDGIDITRSINNDGRLWRLKFGYGKSRATLGNLPANGWDERVMVESSKAMQFVVSREFNGLTLRASHLRAKLKLTPASDQIRSALSSLSTIPFGNVTAEAEAYNEDIHVNGSIQTYTAMGLLYDKDDWILQAEASMIGAKAKRAFASRRSYFTLGRRMGPTTVYFGMGRVKPEEDAAQSPVGWAESIEPFMGPETAADIAELGEIAAAGINESRFDQRSTTLGIRWDVKSTVALNLEWSRTRIFSNGSANWGYGDSRDARADVVSATVSFLF